MTEFRHIGSAMKLPEKTADTPRDAQRGSTTIDGGTTTPQQASSGKVINITSLKQATWIRSKLQGTKLSKCSSVEWRQSVMHRGTKEILSDLPDSQKLSPLEIMQRWPGGDTLVTMARNNGSAALTTQGEQDADTRFRIAFSSPASKETIKAHLERVAVIKPIKGTNKGSSADGDAQTAFLLFDYVERLLEARVTEVDLFIALEWFIENDDNDFFPSYAKLKKRL